MLLTSSEGNFARCTDLTSLLLSMAMCEGGSVGKAAKRKFITAFAISRHLLRTPLSA